MSGWTSIDSAPMDGRQVWVKRVYEGRIVKEGPAVFDVPHQSAPMLQPLEADALGRLSAGDYVREAELLEAARTWKWWLNPDRFYAFPTPTHWHPERTKALIDEALTGSAGIPTNPV